MSWQPEIISEFIVRVDELDRLEWASLLESFPNSSVYQSREYGEIAWSDSNLSHITLAHGDRIVAAAQVRLKTLPVVKGGLAYVRWAPLAIDDEAYNTADLYRAALEALKVEYVERRNFSLIVLPNIYSPDAESTRVLSTLRQLGFSEIASGEFGYRTFRLCLDPTLEALRGGLNQKWRNMLKNAEKNELTVVRETALDSFDRFLELYDQMLARKGFEENVDPRMFRRMQASLPEPLKMAVFLCYKDEEAVCGAVVSKVGDTGIYLFGATSDDALPLKASYILHWEIVKWLKLTGARFYDLGGIDPEANPGVYRFKKGFGGEDVSLVPAYVYWKGWMMKLLFEIRRWLKR